MTILLSGAHENNTDTMILLHADAKKNAISLISLPRDLYYNGRKINDIYRSYGGIQFTDEISSITGLNIKKYVIIDMYAFIDVINILGGLDINLATDLIDPTYKVRDNGVWSTLYYSKGEHHINGIEALRIARARHYTPLFSRDKRQQEIILSLKKKVTSLDAGDIGKMYDIVRVIINYVDTNLTPFEIVSAISKYKNCVIKNQNVLSTANVLYQTYSNLYLLEDKGVKIDENFNKGAWIVLPKGNDWNLVKWFVRKELIGESNE